MLRTTHFYSADSYPLDRRFIHWIGLIHWITYPPFVQPAPEDELKYLSYEYKNSGRLYLLPKIHKRLSNVPGRPVISNCGTSIEKASEFLDHHLKPIMKARKSYIRDTGHFLEKRKEIGKVPENALLVTADVTSIYPSIPHDDGLRALYAKLLN